MILLLLDLVVQSAGGAIHTSNSGHGVASSHSACGVWCPAAAATAVSPFHVRPLGKLCLVLPADALERMHKGEREGKGSQLNSGP